MVSLISVLLNCEDHKRAFGIWIDTAGLETQVTLQLDDESLGLSNANPTTNANHGLSVGFKPAYSIKLTQL